MDDVLREPITVDLIGREWVGYTSDRASQIRYLDNFVDFWHRMGYDFVRFEQALPFRRRQRKVECGPRAGSDFEGRRTAKSPAHQAARIHGPGFVRAVEGAAVDAIRQGGPARAAGARSNR